MDDSFLAPNLPYQIASRLGCWRLRRNNLRTNPLEIKCVTIIVLYPIRTTSQDFIIRSKSKTLCGEQGSFTDDPREWESYVGLKVTFIANNALDSNTDNVSVDTKWAYAVCGLLLVICVVFFICT